MQRPSRFREEKKWLPAIVPIDFQKPVLDGLIPNPGKYPVWREIAGPLYGRYSVQPGSDHPSRAAAITPYIGNGRR